MSFFSQTTLAIMTVALAVLIFVVSGARAGGLSTIVLVVGGFALYWRSGKFRWTPILWIIGIIFALLILAYAALLSYAQGWEH